MFRQYLIRVGTPNNDNNYSQLYADTTKSNLYMRHMLNGSLKELDLGIDSSGKVFISATKGAWQRSSSTAGTGGVYVDGDGYLRVNDP